MSVGEYATVVGARRRIFGPTAGPSANDGLLAEICGEVNDFVESTAERVLAPVPTFSAQVTGTAGDRTLTISGGVGLDVGDDLLVGNIDGNHESVAVIAINPDLDQDVDDWATATGYALDDVAQPTTPNGHSYRCVQAGTSGEDEPTWPTAGEAIGDAEVIWLDLGLTNATIRIQSPLLHTYASSWCQRIYVLDGFDAVEQGRCLLFPTGVYGLAALEVARSADKPFSVIDPTSWYLQPGAASRRPGWPPTEVWLAGRTYSRAARNVRLIGPGPVLGEMDDEPAFGFPRVPEVIRTVAYNVVASRWQMRATGGTYEIAPGSDQVQVGQFLLSKSDWITLQDHARGWLLS